MFAEHLYIVNTEAGSKGGCVYTGFNVIVGNQMDCIKNLILQNIESHYHGCYKTNI